MYSDPSGPKRVASAYAAGPLPSSLGVSHGLATSSESSDFIFASVHQSWARL
jgi:hypothetical protein